MLVKQIIKDSCIQTSLYTEGFLITCTVFLHQVYLCSLAPFTFSFWSRDFIFIVAHKINYEAWGYLSISSAYF